MGARKEVRFEYPTESGQKIPLSVSLRAAAGSRGVAESVAKMCFQKLQAGKTKAEAESFRNELLTGYIGGPDAPESSDAWNQCRACTGHTNPLVSFSVTAAGGKKIPFQTTQQAAGGNLLDAERVARLCWMKFEAGWTKDQVIQYRNKLYKDLASAGKHPSKRRRVA